MNKMLSYLLGLTKSLNQLGQVGSGKADLKLSENLYDISKLNAGEEKKVETNQYMQNAIRAARDLEFLDVALDRLQNLTIKLQELAVESSNDLLSQTERERFIWMLKGLKKEFFDLANQNDSFGNSLFGGSLEEKILLLWIIVEPSHMKALQ